MAAENASLGAGGFDKSFAVMDKELDGKPHIQSVILSSDGNGDACGASLQLKIRVHAGPNARIAVLQLDDNLEVHVTDESIHHASREGLDSLRNSGNWASSSYRPTDGVTTRAGLALQEDIYTGHQETPRRLYTSGMRLSPSPTKERLFPPSPSTSSDRSNINLESFHGMGSRDADLQRHFKRQDEETVQRMYGYQPGSEPDSNDTAPPELSNRDLASHGSSPSRRSIAPRDRPNWTESLHQRDDSGTTIIHWTPKNQHKPHGEQSSSPCGRSRGVVQSPRTSDINIPKRDTRSRIPIKSENHFHPDAAHGEVHQPLFSLRNVGSSSPALGVRTNSENLRSIQDAHRFHIAGTKLPLPTCRSGFSPLKMTKTPTRVFQEQKSNSEPGKPLGKKVQPTPTTATATRSGNHWGSATPESIGKGRVSERLDFNEPLAGINARPEKDVFFDRSGRSSFVASWLHGNPHDNIEDQTGEHDIEKPRPSIIGGQLDGTNEQESEVFEDRVGLESSLLSDRISLPSPTPSSKLSMPWNSAEELAERNADISSLLDLENIEYHPIAPEKPTIESIEGVLLMRFPCDAVSEVVIYEAKIELRKNEFVSASTGEISCPKTGGLTFDVKWQLEYKPLWHEKVPKLSLNPKWEFLETTNPHSVFSFGHVRLSMEAGKESEEYICEDCGGPDGLIDGMDLKVLLHQLTSYRWLLFTLRRSRENFEKRVQRMRDSVPALRCIAVRRHSNIVLLHYGLVFVLVLLMMGGIFFILIKEASTLDLSIYQGGGCRLADCFNGASQIPPRDLKMIEAGTISIPVEYSPGETEQIRPRSGLADNTSKIQDKAVKTNLVPRTSTTPKESKEVHSKGTYQDNMPPRTIGQRTVETKGTISSSSDPSKRLLATARCPQKEIRRTEAVTLEEASKDNSIRDRIDRFLGWRGTRGW